MENLETWLLVILIIAAAVLVSSLTVSFITFNKGGKNGTRTHFVDTTKATFSREGQCAKCKIRSDEET